MRLLVDIPRFWFHAWGLVLLDLLKTIGVAGLALALCGVIVHYIEDWIASRSHRCAFISSVQYFREKVRKPLIAFLAVFVLARQWPQPDIKCMLSLRPDWIRPMGP